MHFNHCARRLCRHALLLSWGGRLGQACSWCLHSWRLGGSCRCCIPYRPYPSIPIALLILAILPHHEVAWPLLCTQRADSLERLVWHIRRSSPSQFRQGGVLLILAVGSHCIVILPLLRAVALDYLLCGDGSIVNGPRCRWRRLINWRGTCPGSPQRTRHVGRVSA